MGGDLVSDDPLTDVVLVRQSQVLLGRDVAQHRCSRLGRQGGADGRRDVVVAGSDIRHERPQHVERRFVANLTLLVHVHLHQVHGNMARPLDHHLAIVLPGLERQFTERLQLRELGPVVGVGQATGTQPVAQAERHVVGVHDLAELVEVRVPEVLLLVR